MRLLVTRPDPDAGATVARLRALGIDAVAVPLLECTTQTAILPAPDGLAAIALTSANALRALDERQALAPYRPLPVFAIGDRTAEAARRLGFACVASAGGSFTRLVDLLATSGRNGAVFYPRARQQSHDLAHELARFGLATVDPQVYEMRPRATLPAAILAALADGDIGGVLLYSRRTAETFLALTASLDVNARRRLGVLCLSGEVAASLAAARFGRIAIAGEPSEEAMLTLASAFAGEQNTA